MGGQHIQTMSSFAGWTIWVIMCMIQTCSLSGGPSVSSHPHWHQSVRMSPVDTGEDVHMGEVGRMQAWVRRMGGE